ncbi:MAG: peptidylprolyl isomerase [Myxococcales bacterium]|nr:peptidylprolyl isomerase [Myxococcales bacterium]
MRLLPLILSVTCLATVASCTQPPTPTKANPEDIQDIQPADGADKPSNSKHLGDLPDPVARVGEKDITLLDFRTIYDLKVQKYKDRDREIPASADRRYRKSITDRLIYQEVLRQEAAAMGVTHDEKVLAEREAQQKRGIKDWDKHLKRRGETEQSLRDMYIAELLERALLEKTGALIVSPEEIDAEYEKVKPNYKSEQERVRAAHILIPVGPERQHPRPGEKVPEPTEEEKAQWKAEAMKKAEEVFALASAPDADFEALAKEHSVGPSASKGGDLGVFTKDRMVEPFSVAAFKLEVGQISKPVETKFGIHVIKLLGRYAPGDLPKEALEDQLKTRLEQRKLHQGRRDMKERLLEKYKVKNFMQDALGPDPRSKRKRPPRRSHPPGPKPGKAAPNDVTPPAGTPSGTPAAPGKAAPAPAEAPPAG